MKVEIKNRWFGEVIFAAEVDAATDADKGVRLGLAVKAAINAGANLAGANLAGATLAGANLAGANLAGANLDVANLDGATLAGANLDVANLYRANLAGANLAGANLAGANLAGATLAGANLDGANLYRANLDGATLAGVTGLNDWIKCIQVEDWPITYTSGVMQIGCQRHPITDWRDFDDEAIIRMDGRRALAFWRKWKAWLFQTIEMAPAKPTGWKAADAKKAVDVEEE